MDRARELIAPYTRLEGVKGIYLVGSAARPFRDATSDYDIEVAIEDERLARIPRAERHKFVIDPGPPPRVDHEFLLRPWSSYTAMRSSTRDLDHAPFRSAVLLFDPDGEMKAALEALSSLPDDVRDSRLRVHYCDFLFNARRSLKCFSRENALNTRLVVADAINGLFRFAFVARGHWPPLRHWAAQELAEIGVPSDLLGALTEALVDPSPERMNSLVERVNGWLDELGLDFHRDRQALIEWAFLTDEGQQAFATWAIR